MAKQTVNLPLNLSRIKDGKLKRKQASTEKKSLENFRDIDNLK